MDFATAPWYMGGAALTYSIMRSQLTSGQRQTYANKFLNDLSHAHNGLGSQGTDTDCTKIPYSTAETGTATFTNGSTALVGVGTTFTSYSPGDMIYANDPSNATGLESAENIIASITDNTHLTFYTPYVASGTLTNIKFMHAAKWTTANCGILWYQKHLGSAPLAEDTNYPNYAQHMNFPAGEYNITVTPTTGWMLMALALADDDPRAVELLAELSAFYYDQILVLTKQLWTGQSWTNTNYYNDRTLYFIALAAVALKNGVINGPDYYTTDCCSFLRGMPQAYMLYRPGTSGPNTISGAVWGDPDYVFWDILHTQWFGVVSYMYPSAPETAYLNWWYRDPSALNAYNNAFVWSGNNGYALVPAFIFNDPNATQTSISSAPKQYLFRKTDQAECAAYNFTCDATRKMGGWASRTDNTAASATLLAVNAQDFWFGDHSSPQQSGSYQIVKNNVALFGSNTIPTANNCDAIGCTHGGQDSSTLEFGGNLATWKIQNAAYFTTLIPRWSGIDPTGDSQSRYSYGLMDLSGQYQSSANITRALRHIAHFKKAATQEYIIVYDDLATSSGLAKATYLHFNINNPWPTHPNPYPGGVSRTGATITSAQSTAWMASVVLTPGTQTNFITETSWSGPDAYGVKVCAATLAAPTTCDPSNLTAEWIVVHKPAASASSTPALTQLSAANFRVVQADDPAGAKVAAFATGGNTYSTASFVSSHSGIAQYLIAGLAPGTYTVVLNGSPLLSNLTVSAGDNTLYFESTSGAVSIVATTGGPTLSCDLNGDGAVNVADVALSVNAALGLVSCVANFDLTQDGVCNLLDVQRVVNAVIGLSCKLGP